MRQLWSVHFTLRVRRSASQPPTPLSRSARSRNRLDDRSCCSTSLRLLMSPATAMKPGRGGSPHRAGLACICTWPGSAPSWPGSTRKSISNGTRCSTDVHQARSTASRSCGCTDASQLLPSDPRVPVCNRMSHRRLASTTAPVWSAWNTPIGAAKEIASRTVLSSIAGYRCEASACKACSRSARRSGTASSPIEKRTSTPLCFQVASWRLRIEAMS